MQAVGQQALFTLLSHIFFVMLSFWAIQALRFDQIIRKYHIPQARILLIFLAIAIGYNVSEFFISILDASHNLIYLFR